MAEICAEHMQVVFFFLSCFLDFFKHFKEAYSRQLDDGIAEAVISILWAAPRVATDVSEFKVNFRMFWVDFASLNIINNQEMIMQLWQVIEGGMVVLFMWLHL